VHCSSMRGGDDRLPCKSCDLLVRCYDKNQSILIIQFYSRIVKAQS
jgi:hypothetical protein